MKQLGLFMTLLVVGGFSLAIIAIAEPLLMLSRNPRHIPRADDLDWDDPGVDVDGTN